MDAKLIFAVLGSVFLLLGFGSLVRAGRMQPQVKTWLMMSAILSAVAAGLWFEVH